MIKPSNAALSMQGGPQILKFTALWVQGGPQILEILLHFSAKMPSNDGITAFSVQRGAQSIFSAKSPLRDVICSVFSE